MSSNKLLIFTLGALLLGILFGLFLPDLMLALAFVGDLFVNILQIIFIPLVASAIITGVSAFASRRQVAKAALATLTMFLGTTIIAILIGLVLTIIFRPGVGINTGAGFTPGEIVNAPVTQSLDFLSELVPSNIINAVTHGKFLGWMIFLTILAAILGTLGQKAKAVTDFFDTIYAVVQKVLGVVINFVPVGIFFLMGTVVARNSGNIGYLTDGLGKFSLVLLFGFLLHALLVIPAILKFLGQISPLDYFKNVLPALKTALVTASPTAALPVAFENSIELNKIDKRIAAMVLPIGSSLNVNGRALYVTVSALFIAQAFELNLGITGTLYVAVAAMFFSLGTATVPFAGMLTIVSVFDSAGFPSTAYAGIGIIFALDWFWGRIFAALDVWSSTAVTAVVEKTVLADIARPERKEPLVREPERRFERGRERRDFPPRRGRDDRKRPDFRPERPPRPYTRPEREPVPPYKPAPKPEAFSEGPKRPERPASSPFEFKSESVKAFNPEAVKAAEPAPLKPPFPKKEASDSGRDDRRKLRERKHFSHGHDAAKREIPVSPKQPEDSPEEEKPAPVISVPRVVPAPPLIREIGSPKENTAEATVPSEVREVTEAKENEAVEMQTSLFGRTPQRKGFRPKPDEPPKPVEESESYATKEQEFGRSIRKKKST